MNKEEYRLEKEIIKERLEAAEIIHKLKMEYVKAKVDLTNQQHRLDMERMRIKTAEVRKADERRARMRELERLG